MTLPELAIRRPITILVTLISIIVIGAIALRRLPLAFMPDMEARRVFVIVDYPNASPKAVERMIVRPLEEALGSISGLKHMWSNCDENGGRVNLSFDWNTDIDIKRAEIRERLDRHREELPEDVERITLSSSWNPKQTGDTIMEARLSSGRNLSKDYDLLDRKILRPLERIPGVASVILDGVNPREVHINLRLNAIKRHNLDVRDLLNTLTQNNLDRSLGKVRNQKQTFTLRATGSFKSIDEIANLPISGTDLKLRDIAEVTYKEPPLEYGRHLDGQFAVGLSVTKESSANTVAVCNAVREMVAQIAEDPELEGINFLVWQDQGREITNTINDLKQTGLFGAILACFILFLFLRRMSTTIIAVICIPFSVIVACGVVWALGKTLNTITLLGLIVGIGMLVDNAVVIMENIVRFQQKGYSSRVSALLGSREVSVAVIAATLTSIIVFLPLIFSKPSEMNILLRELALTVCFTLLASLFISQTLIPMATGRFLKDKDRRRKPGKLMTWLQERYAAMLAVTLNHRWIAPVIGLIVIVSAAFPILRLNYNLDTNELEMFVTARYRFSEDLSLERKEEIVTMVEKALEPHKEKQHIDSIYSWWSDRFSMTRLYMEDGFTTESAMNRLRRALPDLLPKIAGVRMEVMDNGPFWQRNRGKRVGAQIQGTDTETLSVLSREAKQRLETIPGLFDFFTDSEGGSTEVHARVDRNRAREYGIDINQPAEVVGLTFRGRRLPRFKGPDGEVEMRLTLEEREVESLDQLKNLPFLREEGMAVPLESFAEFSVVKGPEGIRRNNKVTSQWVGARFEEGQKADYMRAIRAELEKMALPYGYRWDFQSFNRDQAESQKEFVINLILALGLIFAVMAGLFESMRQALSLMISLPLAVTGAAWALYLSGTDFDQPASVGLLLLLGIVVNNGIVMIEHFNQYRRAGMERTQAILRGGPERLRPILMTALTTLVGLIPMAVQQPSLGGVYYYSMAFVIMGGLLLSTVLTSILLPTTVCLVEDGLGWLGRVLGIPYRWITRGKRAGKGDRAVPAEA